MVSPAPPGEAPPGEVWGGAAPPGEAWGVSGRVFASGGCRIIMCGLIVDLTKGRAGVLGGGMSALSFSSRLVGWSGEAGGDWA